MTQGELIKAKRKNAGLTQRELGERLGVSYQTVAQWENDLRNPKPETLKRISDALGCTIRDLLPPARAVSYGVLMADMDHRKWIEGWMDDGYTFSGPENDLIYAFSQMNDEGQFCAVRLVQDLAQVPKYKKFPGGGHGAVDPQENDKGRA